AVGIRVAVLDPHEPVRRDPLVQPDEADREAMLTRAWKARNVSTSVGGVALPPSSTGVTVSCSKREWGKPTIQFRKLPDPLAMASLS
ncbi:MAG: hypothetical protein QOI36_5280, partial [Pseudonocardiales bacterium]|nr:hypothetical protein [Pseudonocardiales bacterium]